MTHWIWLVLAFMAGSWFGFLLAGLLWAAALADANTITAQDKEGKNNA